MTNQEYEAEIARLTQGYEDLKELAESYLNEDDGSLWDAGFNYAISIMLNKINKITGGEK